MTKPIKKFRAGNVSCAIWLNEREVDGNVISFKTISLTRSFKKKDEEIWRNEVVNLRRNDLQKAILVLQKTQEDLLLEEKEEESSENE